MKNPLKYLNKYILITFLILQIVNTTIANQNEDDGYSYFHSITGLENLYKTEVQLLKEMQIYINNLQLHINELQSDLKSIQQEHNDASRDLEGYLNNPINAYRLIKRLHTDWPTFQESIVEDATRTIYLETQKTLKQNLSFPKQNDMIGSTLGVVRLQKTYRLQVAEMANGILNGIKYGSAMSWQDCYMMGEYLFAMKDYKHSVSWFKETTLKLISTEDKDVKMTLEFLETIVDYYKEMGDFESALELNNYLVKQNTQSTSLLESKKQLEDLRELQLKEDPPQKTTSKHGNYNYTHDFLLYEKTCRDEFEIFQHKSLFCKYHNNNNPYLILQPYKLEQLSIDPYIIYVYDVISDKELQIIKNLAKPLLKRSKVITLDGMKDNVVNLRTSHSTWFKYSKHRYIRKWLLKIKQITGLNTDNAEDLQIANYCAGGHYEPHFDFFTENVTFNPQQGNRMATAIYYLSDVEQGGGTAFPLLEVLVKPRKGALLFWYNLHASGDRDYRTKHAACPVLKGSKWIANVWLKEREQFATRLCNVTTNHEISLKYKDH